MTEKKIMLNSAVTRLLGLQFKGSRGDRLGMGRLSIRPSELMRKTLPDRSEELCLDLDESMVEEDAMDAIVVLC